MIGTVRRIELRLPTSPGCGTCTFTVWVRRRRRDYQRHGVHPAVSSSQLRRSSLTLSKVRFDRHGWSTLTRRAVCSIELPLGERLCWASKLLRATRPFLLRSLLLQWDAAPLDSDAPLVLNPGEHKEEWCARALSGYGHRSDVHERHVRLQKADPNVLGRVSVCHPLRSAGDMPRYRCSISARPLRMTPLARRESASACKPATKPSRSSCCDDEACNATRSLIACSSAGVP